MLANRLLESVLGASELSEVSDEALHSLIHAYPYFAPAHWWLARKTVEKDQDETVIEKVSIHSISSIRLQAYLYESKDGLSSTDITAAETAEEPTTEIEEVATVPEEKIAEAIAETDEVSNTKTASEEEAPATSSFIQPLFTEDYFAYTGAKLPENLEDYKKPTMAQLLSFTDWLRTFKRPAGSTDPDLDPEELDEMRRAEEEVPPAVKASADASLENEEIFTESMAEVRVKQGQLKKAIDIYKKLSLLNPGKSSYFARKIEELQNKS